jgi:hypothetical protein
MILALVSDQRIVAASAEQVIVALAAENQIIAPPAESEVFSSARRNRVAATKPEEDFALVGSIERLVAIRSELESRFDRHLTAPGLSDGRLASVAGFIDNRVTQPGLSICERCDKLAGSPEPLWRFCGLCNQGGNGYALCPLLAQSGLSETSACMSAIGGEADMHRGVASTAAVATDPERKLNAPRSGMVTPASPR